MSDELIVSGSGSTAVATDELFSSAQQLHRLAIEASELRADLAAIDGLVSSTWLTSAHGPASAARAESDLHQAVALMSEIETGARALEWALDTAADGYGYAERFIGSMGSQFAGALGGALGSLIPLAIGAAPTVGAIGLVGAAAAAHHRPAPISSHALRSTLTRPETVAAVRAGVMGADDALQAAAGVPRPLANALGDSGLGVVSTASVASLVMGAGGAVGVFREGPVYLTSAHSRDVASLPQSFAERVARIPDPAEEGGAQVVVEKYSQPGAPDRFEVYVGGTVTFDPVASAEPFDLTSNIANAAGKESGAYQSVVEAMRLAGVTETSPVQFTGYSQGGATAALLAASGDFATAGLATFGAPAGEIIVPESVPTVMVEHTDDLVPALGGAQKNSDAVIIQRDVFGGRELPDTELVPAHDLRYYAETARLMDSARSDQIVGAAQSLESFARGATTVTSTAFTFARGTAGDRGVTSATFP